MIRFMQPRPAPALARSGPSTPAQRAMCAEAVAVAIENGLDLASLIAADPSLYPADVVAAGERLAAARIPSEVADYMTRRGITDPKKRARFVAVYREQTRGRR